MPDFIIQKLGIYALFEKHAKEERHKKCMYSISSLLMLALHLLLFRCRSKNDFYQKKKLGKSYKNIAKLSHLKEDQFPHSKTIDDAFLSLDPLSLEPILLDVFKKLMTSFLEIILL